MMTGRKATGIWLLLGLGWKLQVIASLSITEIVVLACAPFIFVKNYRKMKRDGVMPLFILSLLVVFGCIVASLANHTQMQYVLRGLAVTCIVSCSIIFSHWILRLDPGGFRWFVLTMPISVMLSTFVFRTAVETTMLGETAEEIMGGPIFWISRLKPLVLAPTKGWYLQMPWFVNMAAPIFMAVFSVITSVSGRSAALATIGFAAFVLIGGKSRKSMSRIARHFWLLCGGGVLLVFAMYCGYKFSASQGLLGEDARKKYEAQTHGGEGGIGRLLLGGRGGSFMGLLACRDKPVVGWGPWAVDTGGYAEEFINRFGTWQDIEDMRNRSAWEMQFGISTRLIGCHSYITEFWLWYGIWGLVFWFYIIYVLLRYLKQDVAAVPQWFAWLACSIPGVFWGIFFSPFSDRFGVTLFVVACLMARAVRTGKFQLPLEMVQEIKN